VTPDLDTLLIALYVEIDDHVIRSGRRRPGGPRQLSDAELVCLAVAQVLLGARSEHHWLRMCYGRPGHLFPYLPHADGTAQLGSCRVPYPSGDTWVRLRHHAPIRTHATGRRPPGPVH